MNESNGKKQTVALWIFGILVIVLIAIIVGLLLQAQTRNQELAAKDAKIEQKEQELAQLKENNNNDISFKVKEYKIDLTHAKKGDKIKQVIDNNYTVYFDIENEFEDFMSWKVSVNDGETIIEDASYYDAPNRIIKVFTFGKYFFYTNHDYTDIRYQKLFAVNDEGKLIKEIYELDNENQGMILSKFTFADNSLIINASRYSHGGSIIAIAYDNVYPDQFDTENFTKIPQDMSVESEYTYKVEMDSSIDFDNPTEKILQTFRGYLESNKEYIVSKYSKYSTKDLKEMIEDYLK